MRILVTAFDPFAGETVNPAQEVLGLLPAVIEGASITTLPVPTAFGISLTVTMDAIARVNPRFVVSLGQAGGRRAITVERLAINWMDAAIPDNLGSQPRDSFIEANGPAAYFSTLPVRRLVEAIRQRGIPADISLSAGAFVCNYLMYAVLHAVSGQQPAVDAGFIHLPFLPEQVLEKPHIASMPLEDMVRGITCALTVLAREPDGISPDTHNPFGK